ncbi:hypothetical protein [Halobaculum sp. P14]|uniref:hypothetical protein n=1 Tax=Halobaculum sp. P14 TaxID=3421638 RepID=UPI003EBC9300
MASVEYWVSTVLSRPREVGTLLVTLGILGGVALNFSDARDAVAVVLGAVGVAAATVVLGQPFRVEWHYWFGGTVLAGAVILVVDAERNA